MLHLSSLQQITAEKKEQVRVYRIAKQRQLSQEMVSFVKQMSSKTVRRHLQQHGQTAQLPWLLLR